MRTPVWWRVPLMRTPVRWRVPLIQTGVGPSVIDTHSLPDCSWEYANEGPACTARFYRSSEG